jgi:hypothetical protein
MAAPRALLALQLLAVARGGLLFALVDPVVNETAPSYTALISPPNSTLALQATVSPPRNLFAAENLVALGAGRTLYTLFANFTTRHMDLVGVDLMSGATVSQVPTPLPMTGIVGEGQQMAFVPATSEVVLLGALVDAPGAELHVLAIAPDTGKTRPITTLSSKQFPGFLGNFAAFSPTSNAFWFQLRNASDEDVMVSFHVDVTTGRVRTVAGCFFNTATYDAARDEFVGMAVYRNGTTLKDVYQAVARVPANATRACAIGPLAFSEGGAGPLAAVAGSLVAFDAEARLLYAYALRKDGALSLVEVHSETGRVLALEPSMTDVELPAAIVVSALCADARAADGVSAC